MDDLSNKLTIGQFARFNNVSEQTLRYYDQIGLLRPTSFIEKTGYRYYHISQCAQLDLIAHMKSLGISLKEIRQYIQTEDTAWLVERLQAIHSDNAQTLALLQNTQAVIERKLMEYQSRPVLPREGTPYLEVIPSRTIYKYDTHINYYYNEDSISNYEYMLREFKNNILKQDLPSVYFYNVSSIMRRENLLAGNFITTELFVFVSDADRDRFDACETVPAHTFLCMVCSDSSREIDYINRMLEEIRLMDYTVCGDYICEVVSEFLSTREGARDMTLKLQIPVSRG